MLKDILATPISPELLTPDNGLISQKSEEIIGPVELADFFLYPFIRFGMRPGKILFEMEGVAPEVAQEAMRLASNKLPLKTKFVMRPGAVKIEAAAK